MGEFLEWLVHIPGRRFVRLFDADEGLVVGTRFVGPQNRKVLSRSPDMEDAIFSIIDDGLQPSNTSWQGLFYIMGKGTLRDFTPLYIGEVKREGTSKPINSNLLEPKKLTHWGDGLYYHIGDLSREMYGAETNKAPSATHARWADALFKSFDPPILKEQVYLYIAPWHAHSVNHYGEHCSLSDLRKGIVEEFRHTLLQER